MVPNEQNYVSLAVKKLQKPPMALDKINKVDKVVEQNT